MTGKDTDLGYCINIVIDQKNTIVCKLFNRKYFIDNKVQGIIVSWIHYFLEIFYLEYMYCLCATKVDYRESRYCTICSYSVPYPSWPHPFVQCEMQSGYFEQICMLICRLEISSACVEWPGNVKQVCTMTIALVTIMRCYLSCSRYGLHLYEVLKYMPVQHHSLM